MNIDFGPRQRKVITGAVSLLAVVVIVWTALFALRGIVRFLGAYSGVLAPLGVAGVLALVLKPVYERFRTRLRLGPGGSVCAVFTVILVPLSILLWVSGSVLVREATSLAGRLPQITMSMHRKTLDAMPQVRETLNKLKLTEKVREAAAGLTDNLGDAAKAVLEQGLSLGQSAFQSIAAVFNWLVLPVYLAFLLMMRPMERQEWEGLLPFLKPETRKDVLMLAEQFVNLIVTFFRGQFVICIAMAAMFALGFGLAGLKYGVLMGVLLGFLNLIPYLGNIVGLLVAIPTSLLQDGGGMGLFTAVMVVFVVVQSVEGYFLTPRIMGKSTGLHPMVIIFSLFFWGAVFDGLLGMILAIPLTAFLVVFWRLLKTKYIRELL